MKPKFSSKRQYVILLQDRVSHTSKALRKPLRCRRITPFSVGVRPLVRGSVLINFGGSALPVRPLACTRVLNKPEAVAICANKLRTFEALQKADVPTVRWTVDKAEASKWLLKGRNVLCRMALSSSGGRGIRVVDAGELPDAPLYTRYFPKTHEFRVHVVGGEAVDIVEKKLRDNLREDREDRSTIRNHRNGWVFAHDNLTCSDQRDRDNLGQLGVDAVRALGLDFGAVDILAVMDGQAVGPDGQVPMEVRRLKKAVVCEVNSAPGIENEATTTAYVKGLNKLIAASRAIK